MPLNLVLRDMINRAALILRYKQPAVDWINESDPYGGSLGLELANVNQDRSVYLVPDDVADDDETVRSWVVLNHRALLENELGDWYTDESFLPQELNLELFDAWFEVECHSVIIDTSEEPIVEEFDEDPDEIH